LKSAVSDDRARTLHHQDNPGSRYVNKEQKALIPTDTGDVVSSWLEENFANYISDTFTAEMEDDLDAISRGEKEYIKVLKTFYGPFKKDVKEKDKSTKKITDLGPVDESSDARSVAVR